MVLVECVFDWVGIVVVVIEVVVVFIGIGLENFLLFCKMLVGVGYFLVV